MTATARADISLTTPHYATGVQATIDAERSTRYSGRHIVVEHLGW